MEYADFRPYSIDLAHTFYVCPQCSALVLWRNIAEHIEYHRHLDFALDPSKQLSVIGPVVEGSIIVVHGLAGMDWSNQHSIFNDFAQGIIRACGHDKFCLIFTGVPGATAVEAWGPDEDLQVRLQAMLAQLAETA